MEGTRLEAIVRKRVDDLIYTSVEDLKSSLSFEYNVVVLKRALRRAKAHGYKTAAKMLEARLRKLKGGKR